MTQTVFRLLVTSALSAALLLVAYTSYRMNTLPGDSGLTRELPLATTVAVAGDIQASAEAVTISSFDAAFPIHYAVLTWRQPVAAEQIALIEYEVKSDLPSLEYVLAWRRADDPDNFHSLVLNGPPSGKGVTLLAGAPQWRGDILELALRVTSHTPAHTVTLERVALSPGSFGGVLASLRDSWLHFNAWNHFSINHLSLETNHLLPSPAVAAACWGALSIALMLCWNAVSRVTGVAALAAAALIPWLALDVLWQKKLWHQLAITTDTFAGKTMHEKQLADADGPLYSYALRLREDALPKAPARILMLHDSQGHHLARLRMQYYLLPHNVYNFNRLPPRGTESSLDYVLLLGHNPPNDIEARGQRLYQDGNSIAVELLHKDAMGYLFRVLNTQEEMQHD